MEEQKGRQSMEELLGTRWTPELAKDLNSLEDKLVEVLDVYYEFQDKHGGMPAWDIIENVLFAAMPWFKYPLGSIPDEELFGE